MRLRAPIHLSDNSDDDDQEEVSYRGSLSRPARSPLPHTHTFTHEAVSPASTLSWTSPRSAPSLPLSHSHSHSHSPPRAPLHSTRLDASEAQRRLKLDVAALRIERRHQLSTQAAAAAAAVAQTDNQRSTRTTSLVQSSGGNAGGDDIVSECRSDLRELTALADQTEHWLAVMRAANTNSSTSQQHERRVVTVEDET